MREVFCRLGYRTYGSSGWGLLNVKCVVGVHMEMLTRQLDARVWGFIQLEQHTGELSAYR